MIAASHELHLIREPEDVGAARRAASAMARRAVMPRDETARAELVATEIASNLLRHASSTRFMLLRTLTAADGEAAQGMELLGVDSGPGIDDVEGALCGPSREELDRLARAGMRRDGLGVGLSSIMRLADQFDLYTRPRAGTVVLARVLCTGARRAPSAFKTGGISVAIVPDEGNGDGWAIRETPDAISALVVDGLGHGAAAKKAADAALELFEHDRDDRDLLDFVERANHLLRSTRGAAAGLCRIAAGKLRFVAIGNVEGRIVHRNDHQGLAACNGTLGMNLSPPRAQVREFPWPAGSTLLLHSDGIHARFATSDHPGLMRHDPAVIAATIFREQRRRNDDATIIALQDQREAEP